MKTSGKVALALCGAVGITLNASAVNADGLNPYTAIVDRNVFNLRPPPPPVTNVVDTAPASKVTLLGIVVSPGFKQVMFKTAVGTPPKETSYALAEGERAGDIEVLTIDQNAGTVRLKNKSEEQNLSMEKDAMKPSAAAGPALPGLPGIPGRIPPPGLPMPPGQPGGGISRPSASVGGNSTTTFGVGANQVARPLRGQAAIDSAGSGRVATYGVGATPQQMTPQQQLNHSLEQQARQIAEIEINRAVNAPKVASGDMPPAPPTFLTPPAPQ
jgi:hypothetical protein